MLSRHCLNHSICYVSFSPWSTSWIFFFCTVDHFIAGMEEIVLSISSLSILSSDMRGENRESKTFRIHAAYHCLRKEDLSSILSSGISRGILEVGWSYLLICSKTIRICQKKMKGGCGVFWLMLERKGEEDVTRTIKAFA